MKATQIVLAVMLFRLAAVQAAGWECFTCNSLLGAGVQPPMNSRNQPKTPLDADLKAGLQNSLMRIIYAEPPYYMEESDLAEITNSHNRYTPEAHDRKVISMVQRRMSKYLG